MKQSLSYVHPAAEVADNVSIDPFVTIDKDVKIGEGTVIESNAVILRGTRIGKNCKIHSGAVVGGIPQDLKFKGEKSFVEIGDNTTVRECATVNRGTAARGTTTIGKNCLVMAYVHVAHDCIIGDNVILVNSTQIAGEVKIDDWAIIGGASVVHQFCHIGKHTMLSGMSGVGKDIPPYIKVGRMPPTYAGVNSIGLRRRGFSNEKINEIQQIYRYFFQKGMNTTQAAELIERELPPSPERDEILLFVRNSQRGLIKGYNSVSER